MSSGMPKLRYGGPSFAQRNSNEPAPEVRVHVELRGFEPLTPCMPCKCSAELSYSPKIAVRDCTSRQASEANVSHASRGASPHSRSSP